MSARARGYVGRKYVSIRAESTSLIHQTPRVARSNVRTYQLQLLPGRSVLSIRHYRALPHHILNQYLQQSRIPVISPLHRSIYRRDVVVN